MADISGKDMDKILLEEMNKDKNINKQLIINNEPTRITIERDIDPKIIDVSGETVESAKTVITLHLHPIAQRIQAAMEYKSKKEGAKLSWNGLSQALDMSPGAPTNWKKGKVSKDTLEKIAEYTGVDFAWLVTGEGEMRKELNAARSALGIAASSGLASSAVGMVFGMAAGPLGAAAGAITATALDVIGKKISKTRLQNALEQLENEEPDLVNKIKQDVEYAVEKQLTNVQQIQQQSVRLVPLISFVQAGNFKEAILNAQEEFVATYAGNLSENAFALEIKGDSMLPDFKPKEKIIVDPDVDPLPGDFVIAKNGEEEATFKKYRPRGYDETGREYFELIPLNDNYPTLDSRFQPIEIIATVIDHIRTLRR